MSRLNKKETNVEDKVVPENVKMDGNETHEKIKANLVEPKKDEPPQVEVRPPDEPKSPAQEKPVSRTYVLRQGKSAQFPLRFPNGQSLMIKFEDGTKTLTGRLANLFHAEYLANPNLRNKVAESSTQNADKIAENYRKMHGNAAAPGLESASNKTDFKESLLMDAQMRNMQARAADGEKVEDLVLPSSLQTEQERKLFSELVDKVVEETHRGDRRNMIACSLNDIIQRIHSKANFDRDNREARVETLQPDCKIVWPRPRDFRKMRTAHINGDFSRVPEFVSISDQVSRMDWDYYYYADESFIFCAEGVQCVNLMYLRKPPNFLYYPQGDRPAVWCQKRNNGEGAWEYLTPDGKSYAMGMKPEQEFWARYQVTDWLLEEYSNILLWGAINQIASLTGDEELKRNSFALFKDGVADIMRDNVCSALT